MLAYYYKLSPNQIRELTILQQNVLLDMDEGMATHQQFETMDDAMRFIHSRK